ncbi:MAG: hypothetical protein PHN75_01185 [Syntrophales bacterium]|nr:hypothetical protein [Syntrophales bacterium]
MNQVCTACQTEKVFTTCNGCQTTLCERCARFELVAGGCGTVVPAYFCPSCVKDPMANPNAIFWQMKDEDAVPKP